MPGHTRNGVRSCLRSLGGLVKPRQADSFCTAQDGIEIQHHQDASPVVTDSRKVSGIVVLRQQRWRSNRLTRYSQHVGYTVDDLSLIHI